MYRPTVTNIIRAKLPMNIPTNPPIPIKFIKLALVAFKAFKNNNKKNKGTIISKLTMIPEIVCPVRVLISVDIKIATLVNNNEQAKVKRITKIKCQENMVLIKVEKFKEKLRIVTTININMSVININIKL